MTIPRGAEFPIEINKLNMAPNRNSFLIFLFKANKVSPGNKAKEEKYPMYLAESSRKSGEFVVLVTLNILSRNP